LQHWKIETFIENWILKIENYCIGFWQTEPAEEGHSSFIYLSAEI